MHIYLFNYVYEAGFESVKDLLERYTSLVGWAESLASTGAQVDVFQRFSSDSTHASRGVEYHFLSDRYEPRLHGWQVPIRLHRVAGRLARQSREQGISFVAHVNGLIFPIQVAHLRLTLPPRSAIVVQHHAEKPYLGWRKWIQRLGLAAADGFLFAALELARPWTQAGTISTNKKIFQIMEGSATFKPQDRTTVRQRTGLTGSPIILWVGRLDRNKDPLTVLEGFKQALPDMPAAKLYMIYHTEELLSDIQELLAHNELLQRAVCLLGFVPHLELENYFNSADYFILGSHYEGSGYALVEAMACGVIPIVTDIPSFRMMTDGGRVGALWPVGDSDALAAALRTMINQTDSLPSKDVLNFFERQLSYPAIADQAMTAYQTIWEKRR